MKKIILIIVALISLNVTAQKNCNTQKFDSLKCEWKMLPDSTLVCDSIFSDSVRPSAMPPIYRWIGQDVQYGVDYPKRMKVTDFDNHLSDYCPHANNVNKATVQWMYPDDSTKIYLEQEITWESSYETKKAMYPVLDIIVGDSLVDGASDAMNDQGITFDKVIEERSNVSGKRK